MAKYNSRIQGLISDKDKSKLEAIKKENSDISMRTIIEDFINDYCSTNPKGIKLTIKETEKEISDIDNQINSLYEDKTKLEIKLKSYKDKLNTTLDSYIDTELNKAVDSIAITCKQRNYISFEEIPEPTFIQVAKFNKVDVETLKDSVKKELF